MLRSTRRAGFTLMEVLVAAALIGVVMAMAMQAFMGLGRISNVTRSKLVASSEASKGVREVAALLRRAHVIYYTGKPILGTPLDRPADIATRQADQMNAAYIGTNDPPTGPIPAAFGSGGYLRGGPVQYNFIDPTQNPVTDPMLNTYQRAQFRFWDWGAAAITPASLGGPGNRLRSYDPAARAPGAQPYDIFFPSPLLYIGEATFARDMDAVGAAAGNQNGTIQNMFLPVTWTFHVVYLCPMAVGPEVAQGRNPAWVATARANDLFPGAGAPATRRRSAIPFELRVFTIPNIEADTDRDRWRAHQILPPNQHVIGAPFDHAAGTVNYDPIPIPFVLDAARTMDNTAAEPPAGPQARYKTMANPGGVLPSGPRVNGQLHTNYNNIGNDPPNAAALAAVNRFVIPGDAPRDKVLASYVDPDSVHGTCVRLLNTIGEAPTDAQRREASHVTARGVYRRYLNAYGGEFLYNHYRALLLPGSPAHTQWSVTGGAPLPRRALVSVATRYRNDSRVDFQFALDSTELDLENLVRFQSIDRRSR